MSGSHPFPVLPTPWETQLGSGDGTESSSFTLRAVAQVWGLGQWCPAPKCDWALTHSWLSCPSGRALPALGPNPAKGICTNLCKINRNPRFQCGTGQGLEPADVSSAHQALIAAFPYTHPFKGCSGAQSLLRTLGTLKRSTCLSLCSVISSPACRRSLVECLMEFVHIPWLLSAK